MLKGIVPVLLSPMHKDGRPDQEGYQKLLDHLFQTPLPALWVLGSAGEAFNLPHAHRVEATKIVAEQTGDRTHLLVGAGSTILPNVYQFFEDTAHLSIGGYHVMPIDRKLSTAGIVNYYLPIADRSPRPLWLYSNPKRMLQFPVEAIRELAQHPNIAGMKVGGYDMALASKLATLNCESFQVMGAGGGNLLGYLAYGIEGVTMSTASCFPAPYVEVFELWQQGKLEEAREKANWIGGVFGGIAPWKNTEDSAELKAVLEVIGICQRWVFPPFVPCTDAEVARIRDTLAAAELL